MNPEAEFFTTHSRLAVKNGWINESTIVQKEESYWVHSLLLVCMMLLFSIEAILNGQFTKWGILILALVWVAPHLKRIYCILFVNVWRQNIPLKQVQKVEWDDRLNELEERVLLTLHSGRRKVYVFRKREAQARPFAETVAAAVSVPLLLSS